LETYREHPEGIILALPRGGVAVGHPLSLALYLPLDVFIARKVGAPGNPEYGLGAVTETGTLVLHPETRPLLRSLSASAGYLEQEIARQRQEIARRQALYRRGAPLPPLAERTVLLVDDGIATGGTFLAAVKALRQLGVRHLVAALPVGPADTLRRLASFVDHLVVLERPACFTAVGNFYADFAQVEDRQVIRYLESAASALEEKGAGISA
jgi:putative phosphoribosyl transferase